MGCGVACVASVVGKHYKAVLKTCPNPNLAWTRGFYCPELVAILAQFGAPYRWYKWNRKKNFHKLPIGTLVFTAPNQRYPSGHFWLKTGKNKFMNPWKNFPSMKNVRAGYQAIEGTVSYVIEPITVE